MTQAKLGDTVIIHYAIRRNERTVFNSTQAHQPFQFVLGKGQLIKGLEQALLGMRPGEEKTVTVPPEEGYGQRKDGMVVVIGRERLPENAEPQIGEFMELNQRDGSAVRATIIDVNETNVTVDANHPLAGQPLTIDIALLDVA